MVADGVFVVAKEETFAYGMRGVRVLRAKERHVHAAGWRLWPKIVGMALCGRACARNNGRRIAGLWNCPQSGRGATGARWWCGCVLAGFKDALMRV